MKSQLYVEFPLFGSTLRLVRGTKLYFEPAHSTDYLVAVSLNLYSDEEFDVVAYVAIDSNSAFVGLVVSGYGLVWANATHVVASYFCQDQFACPRDELVSLELRFNCRKTYAWTPPANRIPLGLVTTLGLWSVTSLTSLSLDWTIVMHADLAAVLNQCRALESLTLDNCIVESLVPLFRVYKEPHVRLASLSLLGIRPLPRRVTADSVATDSMTLLSPLLNALVDGSTRHVLRELVLDLTNLSTKDARYTLKDLTTALTPSSSLTQLHVVCREAMESDCRELLSRFRETEATLMDPTRIRALLSVLRTFGVYDWSFA